MPGMLAFGAMAGVAEEYLKQSEESRKNKYQEMRDARLSEIRKSEMVHGAEIQTTENKRQEVVKAGATAAANEYASGESKLDRDANDARSLADRTSRESIESNKPINLGEGEISYNRDGTEIARGGPRTFAPTAGSVAASKWNETKVYRRGKDGKPGPAATYKELADEWKEQAYIDTKSVDEFNNPITIKKRNPAIPGLIEYQNQGVTDDYQLEPNTAEALKLDPGRWWAQAQKMPEFSQPGGKEKAIEAIKSIHKWWKPEMEGGQTEKTPSAAPVSEQPSTIPGTPLQSGQSGAWTPASGSGGMLTAGSKPYDPNVIPEGQEWQNMTKEQIAAKKAQLGR